MDNQDKKLHFLPCEMDIIRFGGGYDIILTSDPTVVSEEEDAGPSTGGNG